MSEIISSLRTWGCDIDGAMERMCDDEEFYIECLHDIIKDSNFETLKAKLNSGDVQSAFDAAHTLKGVFANMGLTPMYNKIVEMVEPLRAGSNEGLSVQYAQLIDMKKYIANILDINKSEV